MNRHRCCLFWSAINANYDWLVCQRLTTMRHSPWPQYSLWSQRRCYNDHDYSHDIRIMSWSCVIIIYNTNTMMSWQFLILIQQWSQPLLQPLVHFWRCCFQVTILHIMFIDTTLINSQCQVNNMIVATTTIVLVCPSTIYIYIVFMCLHYAS